MKRLAAIVLAAGQSSRFGAEDKLRADLNGKPVLEHVLQALKGLGLSQTILVTRSGSATIAPPDVTTVINSTPEAGMGSSLALGMNHLEPCDGVFVVLGDMPLIDSGLLRQMLTRLDGHDIVIPEYEGQRGHPVLFSPACFAALGRCRGDTGARHLIASGDYRLAICAVTHPSSQIDVDTPEDLQRLRGLAVPKSPRLLEAQTRSMGPENYRRQKPHLRR